jgi:hypothetical protein
MVFLGDCYRLVFDWSKDAITNQPIAITQEDHFQRRTVRLENGFTNQYFEVSANARISFSDFHFP